MMLLFNSMFSFSGTKKAWVSFHLCHSSKFSLACLGVLSSSHNIPTFVIFKLFEPKKKQHNGPWCIIEQSDPFTIWGSVFFYLFILSPICSSFYLEMSKEIKSNEKYREYDLNKSTCFFPQFSLTFTELKKKIAIFSSLYFLFVKLEMKWHKIWAGNKSWRNCHLDAMIYCNFN